jgi:hypothetical protein
MAPRTREEPLLTRTSGQRRLVVTETATRRHTRADAGAWAGTTGTTYFADGVVKTKVTYTVGKPNAKGISVVTGSGKCLPGGTGVHKHETCSLTMRGTFDTKTTITSVKTTGIKTRY